MYIGIKVVYGTRYRKQFSNERYMTAIVGSSAVEVMALDKDGNVTLQHQLKVESDHFINYQVQVSRANIHKEGGGGE